MNSEIRNPNLNMTQVIACSTSEGIVLATDSLATWFDSTGGMRHFNLKKILRLGSHAAMVSAGMGIGVEMGLAFQQFLRGQSVEGIEEMARFAMPFFTDLYGKHLRRGGVENPSSQGMARDPEESSPLSGVYLILAGYSFKNRHQPYHLHLLGSEEDGISIKIYPASHIILIPRSLSMERKLETLCKGGSSLNGTLSPCKSFLKKRSDDEEVGPPFYFATITSAGFREVMEEEVEG